MQTSVKLQDPFSYSIYPIFIILAILIIYTIILFLKHKKKDNHKPISRKPVINLEKVKLKYIKKLQELEQKLNTNKIGTRIAYQSTSSIIRHFVCEVTNIKVQNYTLTEIANLEIPELYELVKEYYIPEFAVQSLGDIKESIKKTRKVIEKWS